MRTKLLITLFFNLFISVFSQGKDLEVNSVKQNDSFVITVKNNLGVNQEVTMEISGFGFEKINSPITKQVGKNETVEFAKITPIKNKSYKYSYKYEYSQNPTQKDIDELYKALKGKEFDLNADFSKGLFVFTKEGCSRCDKTLRFLVDNNIDFKFAEAVENKNYNELLWKIISKNNPKVREVLFPVIILDGKISYDHKDLNSFLKTLK